MQIRRAEFLADKQANGRMDIRDEDFSSFFFVFVNAPKISTLFPHSVFMCSVLLRGTSWIFKLEVTLVLFYVYGSVHHNIFYEITNRCSYMQSILFHC